MKKRKFIKKLGVGAAITGMALGAAGCTQQCVYGPPPDEPTALADRTEAETGTDREAAEAETTASEAFDPSDMAVPTVYGPPADPTASQAP